MNHYNIRIDEYELQHDRTRSFRFPAAAPSTKTYRVAQQKSATAKWSKHRIKSCKSCEWD